MIMVRLESQSNQANWSGAGVSSPRGSGRTSRFLAFIGDKMKRIPLTQGKFAIVDDKNYEWLNQWKWYALKVGNTYYAARYGGGGHENPIVILMHRQILGLRKGDNNQTDHRNHNGLDNHKVNLRLCNCSQNAANRKYRTNKSGYKGVYYSKKMEKWYVQIRHKHIGFYDNKINAARAYDKKAKELFGEFANTNL